MIKDIIRSGGSTGSEVQLAPDVVLLLLSDGSARILDFGGNFYAVSETAALMLNQTLEHGMESAAERIASTYGIEKSRAWDDLRRLVADLEKQGVLVGPQGQPSKERPNGGRNRFLACIHSLPLSLKSWALLGFGYLTIRKLGWPTTIRLFQAHHRKQGVTREKADPQAIDGIIRSVAARYPVPVECKERALCCWSILRGMGLPATLVVGISLYPLESHCWCELEGNVLTDYLDKCERFTPVMTYD